MTKEVIEMLLKGTIVAVIYTGFMFWLIEKKPRITKIKKKDKNKLRRYDCAETF